MVFVYMEIFAKKVYNNFMDKKNNVIELKTVKQDKTFGGNLPKKSNAENPIAKKFIKYFTSSKGKFSIKDIFK